jgi:UDP-N-acetylglucosamine--N-acetylmuramyl-(pentapeptide) pyrophosphoryl-undecaprenol N-acetylglucosamine transferase
LKFAGGYTRIAIAGGGTAGHICLGLEVLRAYRRKPGVEGIWIGCESGLESRLVPASGERLETIPGLPFAREAWKGKLAAASSILRGIPAARRLLRLERTQLVIGVGGYASISACLAARSLGLPVVLHEANAEPGLANKLLARFAQHICCGFEEAAALFGGRPVTVTGTPSSTPGTDAPAMPPAPPFRFLVAGGSLGSPFLNREAPRLFASLAGENVTVRHLAGFSDRDAVARAYADAGVEARVDPFIHDMSPVYAEADFVISCAGAMTLAELSCLGLPSLLVPLGNAANDHQSANARAYAKRTGTGWVAEQDWNSEQQAEWLRSLLRQPELLAGMRSRVRSAARPEAADEIVRVAEQLGARS